MSAKVLVCAPHAPLRELLVAALAVSPAVASCSGASLDDRSLDQLLAPGEGVDTVVWAASQHADGDLAAAAAGSLLDHLGRLSACRLIVLASSAIHQSSHHHPGMVDEVFGGTSRQENPMATSWRRLEARALEVVGEKRLTVLRAAPTAVPGGEDGASRLFSGAVAVTPIGFDPSLQVLAPDDLASALRRVFEECPLGVLNVAPSAVVPQRRALALAGVRRLPLPSWLVRWLVPKGQLDGRCYPATVSAVKIAEQLGFEPRYTSAAALRALAAAKSQGTSLPATVVPHQDDEFDPFGMDRVYIDRLGRTLFRFLHDAWWRIEHRGLKHVPRQGAAVLVGVHRGHQPWDAVMLLHLLARQLGRYPRFLIHPALAKFPFLAPYIIKLGGIHASHDNADWALSRGHLIGVFPEGIRGAFCMYRDAYTLRRFARHEYVKMALRHQVPIVPFVTVGSAEIFPIFGRIEWAWFKRLSEWPFLPITPTMGSVPLPSKWHTQFLEPVHVELQYGPEAAEDPAVVRAVGRQIKERIASTLVEMREQRRSIFFGNLWDSAGPAE